MHATSYSGWGTVHLMCAFGYACGAAEHFIDAAVPERVSVAKMYQADNATQHKACRPCFEVAQKLGRPPLQAVVAHSPRGGRGHG